MRSAFSLAATALALGMAPAASAQDAVVPPVEDPSANAGVFDGDYLVLGAGAVLSPSYDGSDDYVVSPVPLVQGRLGGIGISPRGSGIALDFIDDADGPGPYISLGPVVGLRTGRDGDSEDDVVELLPDLDTAIEVGVNAGIGFSGMLNPYDTLTFSADARWDVAGAHEGMLVTPSVSYLTPLSRGMIVALSARAEYADDDFADYYYTVTPEAATVTGLPAFDAEGGFNSVGTTLLLGVDINGDLADGGLVAFVAGGYTRMLGDAKDTPFTSIRGSANQWLGAAGIAYVF
jgi:outer membrane scaffolding protein for murein synthesis (MipA/OmpV family)